MRLVPDACFTAEAYLDQSAWYPLLAEEPKDRPVEALCALHGPVPISTPVSEL